MAIEAGPVAPVVTRGWPPRPDRLRLVSLDEFVQRPSTLSLVRGLVPERSIVVWFGEPKSGKTFCATDLAMHASHGLDWNGFVVPRALRVAYLAGEGISGLKVRLRGWLLHHSKSQSNCNLHVLPAALSLPESLADVLSALKLVQPDLVVVDTLNAYFGAGNENDTGAMTAFCTAVRQLRDELGCSLIVIHHSGLSERTRERGSTVLRGVADVVARVDRDSRQTDVVGFQVIAARDFETMAEPIGLRLKPVKVDWLDEQEAPLNTCVLEATGRSADLPGRRKRSHGSAQGAVLAIIRELSHSVQRGEISGIRREEVARTARQRKIPKQSLSSAIDGLEARGDIRLDERGLIHLGGSSASSVK